MVRVIVTQTENTKPTCEFQTDDPGPHSVIHRAESVCGELVSGTISTLLHRT